MSDLFVILVFLFLIENLALYVVMSLQDILLGNRFFINILSLRDNVVKILLIISAHICAFCGKNGLICFA